MRKVLVWLTFATLVVVLVANVAGGFVAQDNIIYRGGIGLRDNTRQYTDTEWKYIPMSLWVNGAGVSFLNPVTGPHISRLFVVRISAFHSGGAVAGGNTVIAVHDFNTGGAGGTALASLTIPTAVAAWTEVTEEFQVPVGLDNFLILSVATDGGHRQIFATAYLAQVPLRR